MLIQYNNPSTNRGKKRQIQVKNAKPPVLLRYYVPEEKVIGIQPLAVKEVHSQKDMKTIADEKM